MNYRFFSFFVILFCFYSFSLTAQEMEPNFIGEVYLLNEKGEYVQLDKETGVYTRGISLIENSWNVLSLEIAGNRAQTRITQPTIKLVVRAAENNSDPLSIITIYRLNVKKKKRTTVLSENNKGTLMKSRTHTKNHISFSGKKYGNSSYLLIINDITPGEYGIVVANPNNKDANKVIVSCFGVD